MIPGNLVALVHVIQATIHTGIGVFEVGQNEYPVGSRINQDRKVAGEFLPVSILIRSFRFLIALHMAWRSLWWYL